MKTLKLSFLAMVLMIAGTITVKAQTADEVIDKYAAAIGGKDNMKKITSMKIEGTMNAQGTEIGIAMTALHKKAVRQDISLPGMTGYSIMTTTEGWMFFPWMGHTKAEALTADQIKEMQSQLDLQHAELLDYKAEGNKVVYIGKDDIEGTQCHKLKLTTKTGTEKTYYFDASNYYLIRETQKVNVDGKEQESVTNLSNYQKQSNGIVFPMSMEAMGGAMTFTKVEFNQTYDDSVFKPSTN
jgi:hypothetical protein